MDGKQSGGYQMHPSRNGAGGDAQWGGWPGAPPHQPAAAWPAGNQSPPSAPPNPYYSYPSFNDPHGSAHPGGNPYVHLSPTASATAASNPFVSSASNPFVSSAPSPPAAAHGQQQGGGGGFSGGGNPYVQVAPHPAGAEKNTRETLMKVLGRSVKKLEDSTKKATDVAGSVWHHLKTSPSLTDAAVARITQGTKVLAEGGNDKVFQQTFGVIPTEQLLKSFACYISTSAGPVIGTLYLSSVRIAFCSDNPLSNNVTQGQQEGVYYKVVVQLNQLKAVNPSANKANAAEKYIQIITLDNHEFWFMGFVSYDKALKNLSEALQHSHVH